MPFPNITADLAVKSHMYICLKDGRDKELIKCQTFKPTHLSPSVPPYCYIIERNDISRNPFGQMTTIDCDKAFCVSGVIVNLRLLTRNRRNICAELFADVEAETRHDGFRRILMNRSEVVRLNPLISLAKS